MSNRLSQDLTRDKMRNPFHAFGKVAFGRDVTVINGRTVRLADTGVTFSFTRVGDWPIAKDMTLTIRRVRPAHRRFSAFDAPLTLPIDGRLGW